MRVAASGSVSLFTLFFQVCAQLLRPHGRRRVQHNQEREPCHDPGHPAAHGALHGIFCSVTHHLLQVSQTQNAGTAAELKAFEAMGKKDYAGNSSAFLRSSHLADPRSSSSAGAAEHWKHAQQHFSTARSHMVEAEDSDSAAVRLSPSQQRSCDFLTWSCFQASIEALDKRTRECLWAQKFCSAMAVLQVTEALHVTCYCCLTLLRQTGG